MTEQEQKEESKKTEVIRISLETKKKLDSMKAHPSMSYDAVIFAFVNGSKINWNEAPKEELTKDQEDLILEQSQEESKE